MAFIFILIFYSLLLFLFSHIKVNVKNNYCLLLLKYYVQISK